MQRWRRTLGVVLGGLGLGLGVGAAGCGSRKTSGPSDQLSDAGAGVSAVPLVLEWIRVTQGQLVNHSPAGELLQRTTAAALTGVLARHARLLMVRPAPDVITVTPMLQSVEELDADGGMLVRVEVAVELTRAGVMLERLSTKSQVDIGLDPSPVERAQAALKLVQSALMAQETELVALLERLSAPAPSDGGP